MKKVYQITLSEAKRAEYIAALHYMAEKADETNATRKYYATLTAELRRAEPQISFAGS